MAKANKKGKKREEGKQEEGKQESPTAQAESKG